MAVYQIQIRRGTAQEWASANPVLAAGELGLDTDARRVKVGTGTAVWSQLPYVDQGTPQVVASGGIADLTPSQQLAIAAGTIVATPDGRRFAYLDGTKTNAASYLLLGDTSPDWTDIGGRPATFPPPVASGSVLGGVKVGAHVSAAADGTISVAPPYVLPEATTVAVGGIRLADSAALSAGTAGRAVDAAGLRAALDLKADIASLATVATTGSFGDLVNPPAETDGGNF